MHAHSVSVSAECRLVTDGRTDTRRHHSTSLAQRHAVKRKIIVKLCSAGQSVCTTDQNEERVNAFSGTTEPRWYGENCVSRRRHVN